MAHLYSQTRNERIINLIAGGIAMEGAKHLMGQYAYQWRMTKPGRTAKALGAHEVGCYYSDGKLAALLWVDPCPAPVGEPKLSPATGPVPGLHKGAE